MLEARKLRLSSDFLPRLMRRVEKVGECWLWTGSLTTNGYAQISYMGRPRKAHRLVYERFHGDIPEGLFVCHKCDEPRCVNPDHLFAGTNKDNAHDAMSKGRFAVADRHSQAKLTTEKVTQIRSRLLAGDSRRTLAAEFGVAYTTICQLARGET